MYKILLLLGVALAATHGDETARKQRLTASESAVLYTNNNPRDGIPIILTTAGVNALPMTATTNCTIIVHGRSGNGTDVMSTTLRDAFLTSEIINVIVVDWRANAAAPWAEEYVISLASTLTELVRLLTVGSKINRDRLHLVGFGLGAHAVGYVGRTYSTNLPVARLTALNPAQLFNNEYSMTKSDATYVEVIHTETTTLGLENPLGDVDFYPHGGLVQAGCTNTECSHDRSWELFAASLTHGGILGYRCKDEAAVQSKPCTGFVFALGTNARIKYGIGLYTLETEQAYPYRTLASCRSSTK